MSATEGTPLLQTGRGRGLLCLAPPISPATFSARELQPHCHLSSLPPHSFPPSMASVFPSLLSLILISYFLFEKSDSEPHVLIRPLTGKTVCNTRICYHWDSTDHL
ncbi:unnamed protein product [Rangifer tarandus platyrhynchus]|uniref:Uncharacterized protein n=3 Tax=Rangifer tarandus platyrhynchus TaxID=3082113 RepID=A0ABN8ZXC6_RANTA|nr:unnamed protein product [Rangifer tarandus platyrhynchus]CAI9177636.1 unnamed protein product [Rangifer tarandus platyrhynchus]